MQKYHIVDGENSASQNQSQTHKASVYKVQGFGVELVAIDTPGLADTGGMQVDGEHLKNVQQAILSEGFINCVVLVVNGRQSRQTAQISYVLTRLTSVLPKVIADKIVVVYTRVDAKGYLEFDTRNIEAVIGRPIPESHEFCFDNPYACVELLKKNAAKSGRPVDAKTMKVQKNKFADTMESFEELLSHMCTFPRIEVARFKELFDAKDKIEETVRLINEKLKTNAKQQSKVAEAKQDIQTTQDLKHELERQKQEHGDDLKKWEPTKPDPSDNHHMVCDSCKNTCHKVCLIPMEDAMTRFKACECFSSMCRKKVHIRTQDDLDQMLNYAEESHGNVVNVEATDKIIDKNVNWASFKQNIKLCDVDVMGDPAGHDLDQYEHWIKDVKLTHAAVTDPGVTKADFAIGSTVVVKDWSNLMLGENARCNKCKPGCDARLSSHRHWKCHWEEVPTDFALELETKGMRFVSEEEEKMELLRKLERQAQALQDEAAQLKNDLKDAIDTFKDTSSAASYQRVLRAQLDFLAVQLEATEADVTLTLAVRDQRKVVIQEQELMLQTELSLVDAADRAAPKKSPTKIDFSKPSHKSKRIQVDCGSCKGSGSWFLMSCRTCAGTGKVVKIVDA